MTARELIEKLQALSEEDKDLSVTQWADYSSPVEVIGFNVEEPVIGLTLIGETQGKLPKQVVLEYKECPLKVD